MAKIEVAYPPGNPSSEVPAGGTTGQVLTKDSNADYDDSWHTPTVTAPGGADTQLEYNNAGAFGGVSNVTTDGSNLTKVGIKDSAPILPSADSVSAINFTKADGATKVLTLDTTNQKIGVGKNPPTAYFHQKAPITGNNPGVTIFQLDTINFTAFSVDSYGNMQNKGNFGSGSGLFGPTPGDNTRAVGIDNPGNGGRIILYSAAPPAYAITLQADLNNPTIQMGGLNAATAVMLRRNATVLEVKLGNNSDFTKLKAKTLAATTLPIFANNAAAITGGLSVGDFYRTGADPDPVCVVH